MTPTNQPTTAAATAADDHLHAAVNAALTTAAEANPTPHSARRTQTLAAQGSTTPHQPRHAAVNAALTRHYEHDRGVVSPLPIGQGRRRSRRAPRSERGRGVAIVELAADNRRINTLRAARRDETAKRDLIFWMTGEHR